MECRLDIPIKKGDIVYTVEHCKIQQYYVLDVLLTGTRLPETLLEDFSHSIKVKVEKYKEGKNSYKTELWMRNCFKTKEELLRYLEG